MVIIVVALIIVAVIYASNNNKFIAKSTAIVKGQNELYGK